MDDEVERQVGAAYRVTMMVMAASGFSILLFLGLNYFLTRALEVESGRDHGALRVSFTVIVLFLGLGAIALRRYMFRSLKLQTVQSASGVRGLLAHLSRISIILGAMAEAAAIAGLIFGLLTGDSGHATSLILVGLIILIVSYPRRRSWLRAATQAEAS